MERFGCLTLVQVVKQTMIKGISILSEKYIFLYVNQSILYSILSLSINECDGSSTPTVKSGSSITISLKDFTAANMEAVFSRVILPLAYMVI